MAEFLGRTTPEQDARLIESILATPAGARLEIERLTAENSRLRAVAERALRVLHKWPHRKNALHPHIEVIQCLEAALKPR